VQEKGIVTGEGVGETPQRSCARRLDRREGFPSHFKLQNPVVWLFDGWSGGYLFITMALRFPD